MTQGEDVASAIDRVDEAGGDSWASRAAMALLLDDVAADRVVEALDEVAAQVTASGESPRELFGDPDAWAAERRSAWREDGVEHLESPRTSWIDAVGETLIITTMYSGLFLLYLLLTWSWGKPLSLSMLLAPVALAIVSRSVHGAFSTVRARRSHTLGVLAAALTLALGVALTVGMFALTNDITVGGSALLGMLGMAVGSAILGAAVALLAPDRPARSARPARPARSSRSARPADAAPRAESEWSAALGAALRERGDMTDARVREIVAEAQAHARDAGASPEVEFGAPRTYADRFRGSGAVSGRRSAWFSTGLVLLVLVYNIATVLDGDPSIWGIVWLLLVMAFSAAQWRAARRA